MDEQPLKILMLAAEIVPFARTGGLADVAGALPKALKSLGHDVRVAMPRYGRIDPQRFKLQRLLPEFEVPLDAGSVQATLFETSIASGGGDIPIYMVDNAHYFDRDGIYMYDDDADRFILFCRAILEAARRLQWCPDLIHTHDWQTAIVPNWLKTIYRDDPFYRDVASMFTIHNLAFQGVFGHRVLEIAGVDAYGFIVHPDAPQLNEFVDFTARGIYYADIVTTVSQTYASEILLPEYGEGVDPFLRDRRERLFGVLNGIDTELYDPACDRYIAAQYHAAELSGKSICKLDLQRLAGLPQDTAIPLIGIISRLTNQKGFDLICEVLEPLLRHSSVQIVCLGTGEQRYHDQLNQLRGRFADQLAVFFTFNASLSQKIYAGSDMFLMPSRFEPCGLSQMIALRYGSIPIVRATGGLADTVQDFDPRQNQGTGFSFRPYDSMALYTALIRALETYRHRTAWSGLVQRAMAEDFSWSSSARRYVELYRYALSVRGEAPQAPFRLNGVPRT